MDSIQLENGYTGIANELVEQFAKFHLSGNEWQIIWAIWRRTWSWHKKSDSISLTQLQNATNLSRPSVSEAIVKLVGKRVLLVNKDKHINVYSFNKVYTEWDGTEKSTNARVVRKPIGNGTEKSTITVPKRVPEIVPKRVHTKETKETIKNNVRENADKIDYYADLIAKELNDSKSTDLYKHACKLIDPQRLLRKAKEIMKDGGAMNPGAVFTAWYMDQKKRLVVSKTM